MAEEIIVTIRNEIVESSGSGSKSVPIVGGEGPSAAANKKDSGSGLGKVIATNAVKQAASFAISNYGNLTGDYQTQANIQGGIELLGIGMMMMQGPVGVAAAVTSLTLKAVNHQIDLAKRRQETEFLKMRTGMMNFMGGRN